MTELGKRVWKKMGEVGYENSPEGFHLEYYENIIKCTKQVLGIVDVVEQSEQLIDFLIHLNDKGLINNHDFDYHKEAEKYIKKIN